MAGVALDREILDLSLTKGQGWLGKDILKCLSNLILSGLASRLKLN